MVKKIILTILLMCATLPAAAQQEHIRVKIVDNQNAVSIRLNKGELLLPGGQKLTDSPMYISFKDGSLTINSQPIKENKLTFAQPLEVNKRIYQGKIEIGINKSGSGISVINTLALEDFLYNTLNNQVPPLWPKEAIAAQAVVQRSLAMYHKEQNTNEDFDILAVTEQFYTGLDIVRDEVKTAVESTLGQIILWKNKPIYAAFHQSSGGVTDSMDGFDYLSSVVDHDQDSPTFSWTKSFSAESFDNAFKYAGYDNVGKIQAIELSPMDFTHAKQTDNRTTSGRLKTVKIVGDRGFAVVSGNDFAKILQLPSSAFDIVVANVIPREVEVAITDIYGNVVGSKKIPIELEAKPLFNLNRPLLQRINWSENEQIIIKGAGSGTGYGFSQWGSRALALSGKDYKAILHYYYKNVAIEKIY